MVSYLDQLPEELRSADRKEEIAEYLSEIHGDIEDAKITYLFLSDELGFDVEASDIETVTDSPSTSTFG
jgi:phosphopantetheine adenylyltransferase